MKFEGPTPPTFCGIPLQGSPEYYYGRTDVADCHIFQAHLGLWKGHLTVFVPGAEFGVHEQADTEELLQAKLKKAFYEGNTNLQSLIKAYQTVREYPGF